MFINHDVVAVVFRLINFVALIGIAFFVFKKYVKSDLLALITKKKTEQESLLTQQTTLEKQQIALDALLKEETVLCEKFRSKIDTWKKVVTSEYEHAEAKYSNSIALFKKRHAEIVLQKENQRVQNIVIRAVVANLEKSLSLHFEDPKKSTDYLNTILHFMDERVS